MSPGITKAGIANVLRDQVDNLRETYARKLNCDVGHVQVNLVPEQDIPIGAQQCRVRTRVIVHNLLRDTTKQVTMDLCIEIRGKVHVSEMMVRKRRDQ